MSVLVAKQKRGETLLAWLKDGAVPVEEIFGLAATNRISRTELFRLKKKLDIYTLSGSEGDFWMLASDVKFNPKVVQVEEKEATNQIESEVKATERELAMIAARYRRDHQSEGKLFAQEHGKCLDEMVQFAEEHPADPPVPLERIYDIFFAYFPWKTPEQIAEEAEIARLVELSDAEFEQWMQDFRAARSRPPTEEEIQKERAWRIESINREIYTLRREISDLATREIGLTGEEIDRLPDVAKFIADHPAKHPTPEFPVTARTQKALNKLREKHANDTRKLTPEEIQAEQRPLEAQIAEKQRAIEEARQYVPRYISTMTTKDRDFLVKVRAAHFKAHEEACKARRRS